MHKFKNIIRRKRFKKRWSQNELARLCDVNVKTIQAIEAGRDVLWSSISKVIIALDLRLSIKNYQPTKKVLIQKLVREEMRNE